MLRVVVVVDVVLEWAQSVVVQRSLFQWLDPLDEACKRRGLLCGAMLQNGLFQGVLALPFRGVQPAVDGGLWLWCWRWLPCPPRVGMLLHVVVVG